MTRRMAAMFAYVLVFGGAGATWGDDEKEPEAPPSAAIAVGSEAPPVVASTWLNTPEGKSPVGTDTATKVLMIEFWGTWCGPCVRSMPHIQELHERYGTRGLQIVAITRETSDAVKGWIAERRYTFPVGCDPEQITVKAYPIRGWPSTFLVADGKVAYVGDPYGVEAAIEKALGLESGPGSLLSAYLDALAAKDAAAGRGHLERLCEKAPAAFDLKAWARGALGSDPAEAPATKLDAAKALDACVAAAKTADPANRAKALTPLAQSGPAEFDLQGWSRVAFGKVYPVTKDELRAHLDASRFGTALEALLDRNPPPAVLALAAKHEGLVGYSKSKREDLRADARRALMAIQYVFVDEPMKGLDDEAQKRFWEDISVSGMAFDDGHKHVLGMIIAGRMVMKAEAPGFARRHLALRAMMTSLVDGKPMKPAAAVAQAKKEEEEILAELKRTY